MLDERGERGARDRGEQRGPAQLDERRLARGELAGRQRCEPWIERGDLGGGVAFRRDGWAQPALEHREDLGAARLQLLDDVEGALAVGVAMAGEVARGRYERRGIA